MNQISESLKHIKSPLLRTSGAVGQGSHLRLQRGSATNSEKVEDSLRQYRSAQRHTDRPGSVEDPNFDLASSLMEQNHAFLLKGIEAIDIKQALKASIQKVLGLKANQPASMKNDFANLEESELLFPEAGELRQRVANTGPKRSEHSLPKSSQQAHHSARSLLSEMRHTEGHEPHLAMDQNSINLSNSNKFTEQPEE